MSLWLVVNKTVVIFLCGATGKKTTISLSFSGDDLVSFKNDYDAKEYMKNHNGKRIFRFSQVKLQLIELLNGSI